MKRLLQIKPQNDKINNNNPLLDNDSVEDRENNNE